MCGIVAIFAYGPNAGPVDTRELLAIREQMRARGPDGAGSWISSDQRVGLAHRRLAIIDLTEAGAQPMQAADAVEASVITFNGEIYNYRELREELEQDGVQFRSNTDTEVLLQLYRRDGVTMLRHLRGMYAFVIWDPLQRRLMAARDPFGIKPLYVADDGETIRIASQVKALLAGGKIDITPEDAAEVSVFLLGHVAEPFTPFQAIRALPPGVALVAEEGKAAREQVIVDIVDVLAAAEQADAIPAHRHEVVAEALLDAVRAHMIADVEVGVFLSAGKDSSTITALAARSSQHLRTLTLGFDEFLGTEDDEVPLAETIAARLGTHHRTLRITETDFVSEQRRLNEAMDQPTIDGVNSYFIARAAAKAGLKVALSGLGGDELFAGYPTFLRVPQIVRFVGRCKYSKLFGVRLRRISQGLAKRYGKHKHVSALEYGGTYAEAYLLSRCVYLPWELPDQLSLETVARGLERLDILGRFRAVEGRLSSPRAKIAALECCFYMRNQLLRDADWAGMAHSLEIRVPFVDWVLLNQLAPFIVGRNRFSKVDMLASVRATLPPDVAHRGKTGFLVPVSRWSNPDRTDRYSWRRRTSAILAAYRRGVGTHQPVSSIETNTLFAHR